MTQLLEQMQNNSTSLIESEGLDQKLFQTKRRLSRLNSGVDALNQNLLDLIEALIQLQSKSAAIQNEQLVLFDMIGNLDATNLEAVTAVENCLTQLVVNNWNELEALANRVFTIPDIEDKRVVDNIVIFKLIF